MCSRIHTHVTKTQNVADENPHGIKKNHIKTAEGRSVCIVSFNPHVRASNLFLLFSSAVHVYDQVHAHVVYVYIHNQHS
jgi:hypothetical protein